MKSFRWLLSVALLSLSAVAFAQSDAQKSFDTMKTLAGSWEGQSAATGTPLDGKIMHVSLRVTSMGNALVHEMTGAGRPDDPITMLYLDGDRLLLTHYCDAGNRPRMAAKSRRTEKPSTSIFSTSMVARSTDTCTMRSLP